MSPKVSTTSKHFELQGLADGIYAAIATGGGAAISNAGLINLGRQTLVFDTFMTPQAASDLKRSAIELTGQTPQLVVNSHYHNDHIWGNQVFLPEAQIISSARTRQLITTAGMEEFQWYSANSAQKHEAILAQYQAAADEQQRQQLSMWLGYYAGLVEAMPHLSVVLPGITFDQRLKTHGSRYTAELVTFDNAHTGSDTVLFVPQAGIIFMSDLLFVRSHPYLGDGDPDQLLKALKELSHYDAATFVPGHGPVGTLDDLKRLIGYIEFCMEAAQILVRGGNTDDSRIGELNIPDKYQGWQLPQFFQANIKFLYQRLKATS